MSELEVPFFSITMLHELLLNKKRQDTELSGIVQKRAEKLDEKLCHLIKDKFFYSLFFSSTVKVVISSILKIHQLAVIARDKERGV